MKLIAIALFALASVPCFAAGGACPSGVPSGITSCYYVAASGSDSNDGLSEASGHPWLHAPFMPNCTGNCATVTSQNASLWPGEGVIFHGGDTWHFGNSGLSPYVGGTWQWNTGTTPNGTSSNYIYLGVDSAWPSSGWTRPILSADNPLCNASTVGTLPDGATCTGTTDWYGQPSYYVSACGYQISGGSNSFVDFSARNYYIFDNFEMTGLCQSSLGQPSHKDAYINYGSICLSGCSGTAFAAVYEHLYVHGATHLQYAAKNGQNCTGIVCINISVFQGGTASTSLVGEQIFANVIDFSDSDPGGAYLGYGGFYQVEDNVISYTTGALVTRLHIWDNNLYEYFFENGHSNVIESEDPYTTNAVYNNVFRHIETYFSSGGGVFLWFGPQTGNTTYIFNNVGYDVGGMEYLNIGGLGVTYNYGNYVFFNNVFQTNVANTVVACQNQTIGTTADTNNYYVDDETPYTTCSTLTTTTSICQSNTSGGTSGTCPTYSDANVSTHYDQYTGSQTYAYSPVASSNSTVGAGTNEYSGYCSALGSLISITAQNACEADTTYACSYSGSGATPVCPVRTANSRPSSAAWDIGAYEFSGFSGSYLSNGITVNSGVKFQ